MQKNAFVIIVILILIIVTGVAFVSPRISVLNELRDEVVRLENDQKRQKEELLFLQKEIEALRRNDPKAVEKVAREKFGYSKPGEDVYQVEAKYADEENQVQ